MASILLIYPFFRPRHDKTVFRFPPLGILYVAAALRDRGHRVRVLDCTFLSREEAFDEAVRIRADVVGIYSMITMKEDSIRFARRMRNTAGFLVAGGPLPSSDPAAFLEDFDVVVRGEGERTMAELIAGWEDGTGISTVPGIALRGNGTRSPAARGTALKDVFLGAERAVEPDLDRIPFPARDLLPNDLYIRYGVRRYGYAITSIMSTRGCPFHCEFCSNVVFGVSYRARSAENVVDEVERVLALGYTRIHFGDDVFTLDRERVHRICERIEGRRLRFSWECLARVDGMDGELAARMKRAGCERVFFGIESGNNAILRLMNKKITAERARKAVEAAHGAGLKTGAFFILFYPGESIETVLETQRFARSLPLDYLSFTMPYPIPGTRLHSRVTPDAVGGWRQRGGLLFDHVRVFDSEFSRARMRFGIIKGQAEFEMKKHLGMLAPIATGLIDKPASLLLRVMR